MKGATWTPVTVLGGPYLIFQKNTFSTRNSMTKNMVWRHSSDLLARGARRSLEHFARRTLEQKHAHTFGK